MARQPRQVTIAEGFPGQRLHVVPRPRVTSALDQPGTSHLVVTDAGHFPEARAHGIDRRAGIPQAVIIVCVRGRGWCSIDDTRHPVYPGQVLIIPPNTPHSYGAEQDDPWTLWWLHVAGRELDDFLRAANMTSDNPVRTLSDAFKAVGLIEEADAWIARDSSATSLLVASGAAWHLMALLASDRGAQSTRVDMIDQAQEFMRTHLDTNISVGELARRASLSPSHFAALFRKHVGMPVLQYQTQLRMARARELLDTTDLSVAAIASTIGYEDPFYFSRQFKATHHLTALQYRRQAKG